MSAFEERLRERINNLISETMDDVASEIRKAVTPKPTATYERSMEKPRRPWTAPTCTENLVLELKSDPALSHLLFNHLRTMIRIHGGLK